MSLTPETPSTAPRTENDPPLNGDTQPILEGKRAPRLPHERDESVSHEEGPTHEVIEQAALDVEEGLVDTDRGPVLKELHDKLAQDKPSGT